MEKITKRAMYEALVAVATKGGNVFADVADITDEDLKAFCENEIALLDSKAEKARARAAAKKAEGDELTDVVRGLLTDEYQTIADIAAQIEDEDITPAKVTYRLTQLVKTGVAEKAEVSVAGKDGGKARKCCGYKLA